MNEDDNIIRPSLFASAAQKIKNIMSRSRETTVTIDAVTFMQAFMTTDLYNSLYKTNRDIDRVRWKYNMTGDGNVESITLTLFKAEND